MLIFQAYKFFFKFIFLSLTLYKSAKNKILSCSYKLSNRITYLANHKDIFLDHTADIDWIKSNQDQEYFFVWIRLHDLTRSLCCRSEGSVHYIYHRLNILYPY